MKIEKLPFVETLDPDSRKPPQRHHPKQTYFFLNCPTQTLLKKHLTSASGMLTISVPSFVERDEQSGDEVPNKPHTLLTPTNSKSVTFYNINVENENGVRWCISKRYTDFLNLYNVCTSNGDLSTKPGETYYFPPKCYFAHGDDVKEDRREGFEKLLMILNNNTTGSDELSSFLEIKKTLSPSNSVSKLVFRAYDTSSNPDTEDVTIVTAAANGTPQIEQRPSPAKSERKEAMRAEPIMTPITPPMTPPLTPPLTPITRISTNTAASTPIMPKVTQGAHKESTLFNFFMNFFLLFSIVCILHRSFTVWKKSLHNVSVEGSESDGEVQLGSSDVDQIVKLLRDAAVAFEEGLFMVFEEFFRAKDMLLRSLS